jgi:mycothiol system anti-sigma-R factor
MSGKSCEEALDRLYEYIDNELPPEELRRVAEHLENCTNCDAERRVNERIKELVAGCPKEEAPDDLRARVLAVIAEARAAG